ncbi:MAG: FixH family protein [Geobacteraceae bacterium]
MTDMKVSASVRVWQVLIVALVVVFIIGMAATFVTLARKGSPVVDVDYYAHGMRYGSDRNREIRGEKQGWRMETVMREGTLEVRVRDGRGVPVHGGRLTLILADKPYSGKEKGPYAWANRGPLPGFEQRPGSYTIALPQQRAEDRHGKLTFTGSDAMLTQRVVIFR